MAHDTDDTKTTQDAAPHLQYSRGVTIRCANCQCVRRVADTVVADGKRICKSFDDCRKLAQHREDELRSFVPKSVPVKPEPVKIGWPSFRPRWLNTI